MLDPIEYAWYQVTYTLTYSVQRHSFSIFEPRWRRSLARTSVQGMHDCGKFKIKHQEEVAPKQAHIAFPLLKLIKEVNIHIYIRQKSTCCKCFLKREDYLVLRPFHKAIWGHVRDKMLSRSTVILLRTVCPNKPRDQCYTGQLFKTSANFVCLRSYPVQTAASTTLKKLIFFVMIRQLQKGWKVWYTAAEMAPWDSHSRCLDMQDMLCPTERQLI